MTNQEVLKIKPGQKIKIYDSDLQCDVIESVVKIIKGNQHHNMVYVYSIENNWLGYVERVSTPDKIKQVFI